MLTRKPAEWIAPWINNSPRRILGGYNGGIGEGMSLVGGTGALHLITYSRKDFGNWGIIVSVEAKAGTDTADTHGAQSDSGHHNQ